MFSFNRNSCRFVAIQKKNQKEDQKVQKKYEIWIRSILDK